MSGTINDGLEGEFFPRLRIESELPRATKFLTDLARLFTDAQTWPEASRTLTDANRLRLLRLQTQATEFGDALAMIAAMGTPAA